MCKLGYAGTCGADELESVVHTMDRLDTPRGESRHDIRFEILCRNSPLHLRAHQILSRSGAQLGGVLALIGDCKRLKETRGDSSRFKADEGDSRRFKEHAGERRIAEGEEM